MLLIAIVDDERSDSSALKALVDTYFQQNRQAYMIHVFNGALDFIRSTENHDIVFMDIRMDKLDGLEVGAHHAQNQHRFRADFRHPHGAALPSRVTRWMRWISSSSRLTKAPSIMCWIKQ